MADPKTPRLHIVTPVYNEGDNFPALYEQLKANVKTPHKFVVVYDFDEDTTVPVVKKYQANDPDLVLHKNTRGRGVLNAMVSGFDYVKEGPVVVVMGDLCDDLSQVDDMYKKYTEGATIVCPSRFAKGGKSIGGPPFKRFLSWLAGASLYYIRRFPTHDATNNYRLYDKKFIDSITIESTAGFEVALEITAKAFRQHKKIVEIPSVWRDRVAGQSNFKLSKWLPSYLKWYLYALAPRKNIVK